MAAAEGFVVLGLVDQAVVLSETIHQVLELVGKVTLAVSHQTLVEALVVPQVVVVLVQ
jgi:hypothetical protein